MENPRTTASSARVWDVRITDGSKNSGSDDFATIVFSMFFTAPGSEVLFQSWLKETPVLFSHLSGYFKNSELNIRTIEGLTDWSPAVGAKADELTARMAMLKEVTPAQCADLSTLKSFVPNQARDYTEVDATMTSCAILQTFWKSAETLSDDDEVLYQINFAYVPCPMTGAQITPTESPDRLFHIGRWVLNETCVNYLCLVS